MSNKNWERGPTLELSDEQRRRAEAVLDAVKSGEATHPLDLLEEWHAGPTWRDLQYLGHFYGDATRNMPDESVEWVGLDNVLGAKWELYDRFVDGRLVTAFRQLLDGQFRPKYDRKKPSYLEVDGDLYVNGDGTHRTIACKAAGVERIHARVQHVPEVDTTPYRNWMGWSPK